MELSELIKGVDPKNPSANQIANILQGIYETPTVASFDFEDQRCIAKVACLILQTTEGISDAHWKHGIQYHRDAINYIENIIPPEKDLGDEEIHIARKHIELHTNLGELLYERFIKDRNASDLYDAHVVISDAVRFTVKESKYYGRSLETKGKIENSLAISFGELNCFMEADSSFSKAIEMYTKFAGNYTLASTHILRGRNALQAFQKTANPMWSTLFYNNIQDAGRLANRHQKGYIADLVRKMKSTKKNFKYDS